MDNKYFYRRKLPHWQPAEESFFITYRLAGSIPLSEIEKIKTSYYEQKAHLINDTKEAHDLLRLDYFATIDTYLDKTLNEPHWLKNSSISSIVLDSLLFNDNKQYSLCAACVMSNHVHALLTTLKNSLLLNEILQRHKRFTAVQCNKILGRSGQFWEAETFDTFNRNEKHFSNTINYCIQNPVKAGLVKNWLDWDRTYLHPDLKKEYLLTCR